MKKKPKTNSTAKAENYHGSRGHVIRKTGGRYGDDTQLNPDGGRFQTSNRKKR